jgi:regulatory protein
MPDEHSSNDGREAPGRRRVRPEPTPTQRALGLLTRREHSRKELARKLTARGVATEDAEAAVERLAGEGWQNDGRFAESLVRGRAGSGYGPIRIRAELATHGLDRDAIAAALDTFEGDWAELAREQVRRRYGTALADDRALQRRAADFLIRRGFDADCVRAACRPDFDD